MTDTAQFPRDWHHAPVHRVDGRGAYMVTAATLHKAMRFDSPERLTRFTALLFDLADHLGWQLQAWAVLGNHYHWIGLSPEGEKGAHSLKTLVAQAHERTAKSLNQEDGTPGRQVWHNYWESHITFETSYYARLKYVHDNPARHGVVTDASMYRWCSRAWLERTAIPAFVRQLDGFKTDLLKVPDDF
jgi:putative transposase